jgi:hypothetical protein
LISPKRKQDTALRPKHQVKQPTTTSQEPTPGSPWYVVESDVKKHARLNMMAHLLSTIEYHDVEKPKVKLPARPVVSGNYQRPPRELSTYVDDYVATLVDSRAATMRAGTARGGAGQSSSSTATTMSDARQPEAGVPPPRGTGQ